MATQPDVPADPPRSAALQEVTAAIGRSIKRHRGNRMTLSQLAAASNVSIGLLSKLENGAGNPTVQTLNAIAEALETDLDGLLAVAGPPAVSVVRAGSRYEVRRPDHPGVVRVIDLGLDSGFAVSLLELPAGASTEVTHDVHDGDEFLYVMHGSITLRVADEIHHLDQGDSVIFGAEQPHWVENKGVVDVEVFVVASPTFL
jgi:mannose-6-phosphate isomerase-like protein (cupin superfamily)